MLFMVIERFKGGNALPVYRFVRERGRMLPEGLIYVDSWIEANVGRCFELMECDDPRLFQRWVTGWVAEVGDLVEFEMVPVVPSRETAENLAPFLSPVRDRTLEIAVGRAVSDGQAGRRSNSSSL